MPFIDFRNLGALNLIDIIFDISANVLKFDLFEGQNRHYYITYHISSPFKLNRKQTIIQITSIYI